MRQQRHPVKQIAIAGRLIANVPSIFGSLTTDETLTQISVVIIEPCSYIEEFSDCALKQRSKQYCSICGEATKCLFPY